MTVVEFLATQVLSLPALIVYLTGIFLAFKFRQRDPHVSRLCLTAFLIFLGNLILGMGMQFWKMDAIRQGSLPHEVGRVLWVVGLFSVTISTVAWALLLTALFGRRSPASTEE